jgi:hypothetical protein
MADQKPLPLSERQKDQLRRQNDAISTVLIGKPAPKPMTGRERQLLTALAKTGWRTPGNLIAAGTLSRDCSLQGWHQVAASLVHKGWADKRVLGARMHYSISKAGRDELGRVAVKARRARPHTRVCLACADPDRYDEHTCGLAGLQAMFPLGGSR